MVIFFPILARIKMNEQCDANLLMSCRKERKLSFDAMEVVNPGFISCATINLGTKKCIYHYCYYNNYYFFIYLKRDAIILLSFSSTRIPIIAKR